MELALNELSYTPLLENKYKANELMDLFSTAVAEARLNGFTKIRSQNSANDILLAEGYSLHNWLFDSEFSYEKRSIFYDMFVQPFIQDGDEEIEEKYLEADYFFENAEFNIPKTKCLGLTSAYLYKTLSISFDSLPVWRQTQLQITVENGQSSSMENVFNVYSKESFNQQDISEFVLEISILEIIETDTDPNDKSLHLTSHHGKKELNELWNKIKKSPFVLSGLSIAYGGNSFYKNPQKNGQVDIVHLKSDKRYALQIQTTGRNLRETVEIAKRLEEEFG